MERLKKFVQFAGLSSRQPIWIENFKRYCENGRAEECDLCNRCTCRSDADKVPDGHKSASPRE